ncbi:hypothetical protein GCM10027425_18030 [Alteromonas gracilis]
MSEPSVADPAFGPLEVDGGVGGLQVHLDDLGRAGALLIAAATPLGSLALSSGHIGGGVDLAQAATFCPLEAMACEADSLVLVARATGAAAVLLELGRFLTQTTAEFEMADRAVAASLDRGAFLAGRMLPGLALAAVGAGAGVLIASAPTLALIAASPSAPGLVARRVLIPRAVAVVGQPGRTAVGTLYDRPWVAGAASRLLPGVVSGLTGVGRSGDYRGQVRSLLALAAIGGLARDTGASRVRRESSARVHVPPAASLSTLASWQAGLTRARPGPVGTSSGARIRVLRIDPARPGAPPSWVVQVPGTQAWSPERGRRANDLTTNLLQQARPEQMLLMERQVIQAMEAAGIAREGGAVMFTGHSQGGTTVMSLAGREDVVRRFDVRAVATFGAPAGAHPVADGVRVLEVRNEADVVPRFDRGVDLTDEHRIRVTAEPLTPSRELEDPLGAAHSVDSYVAISRSIEESDDASLVAWRDQTAQFSGSGTSTTYDASVAHDTDPPRAR